MLAKFVNDNALIHDERGTFAFFASKLVPTVLSGVIYRPTRPHAQGAWPPNPWPPRQAWRRFGSPA
ncbi:hypothetical protein FIV36_15755 [Pseudomonas extremaustralis]|uniref:Uncharacterized protein n=1 Tax=Pseudomonas extremaustralis TaxID=359110 RepID=A0A5C5QDZ7_9PSED|nr:hypothetical protein FIV36_15755 [Pseudomonas extremaustralis]